MAEALCQRYISRELEGDGGGFEPLWAEAGDVGEERRQIRREKGTCKNGIAEKRQKNKKYCRTLIYFFYSNKLFYQTVIQNSLNFTNKIIIQLKLIKTISQVKLSCAKKYLNSC